MRFGKNSIFRKILPHIQGNPELLQHALVWAVAKNNSDIVSRILPHIQGHPMLLRGALEQAVADNNTDIVSKILPHIQGHPTLLQGPLEKAAANNSLDIVDKILPYVQGNPKLLEGALVQAASHEHLEVFNKILPHIQGDPSRLSQALMRGISRNNQDITKQILPLIQSQDDLYYACRTAMEAKHIEMISQILPYMQLNVIKTRVVTYFLNYDFYSYDQEIFKQILPYIVKQDDPKFLNELHEKLQSSRAKSKLAELLKPYISQEAPLIQSTGDNLPVPELKGNVLFPQFPQMPQEAQALQGTPLPSIEAPHSDRRSQEPNNKQVALPHVNATTHDIATQAQLGMVLSKLFKNFSSGVTNFIIRNIGETTTRKEARNMLAPLKKPLQDSYEALEKLEKPLRDMCKTKVDVLNELYGELATLPKSHAKQLKQKEYDKLREEYESAKKLSDLCTEKAYEIQELQGEFKKLGPKITVKYLKELTDRAESIIGSFETIKSESAQLSDKPRGR